MVKKTNKKLIKEVRRNTRQVYNAEQKILIVMEGLRAELSAAELCRKYSISKATYYKWSKEFIEAGKKRLSGNETREATSEEVKDLRRNTVLKESLADLVIRYDIVKKAYICWINPST
ncbi:transposase [Riemerella columbipharyngis]|uniref:Transposase n=1 Tax=Riemerella columbipharyngis TaxID=1071918 RepID=A0A1G7AA26_9FLAO|nr:transposase [Riemerella columbipharyngis]SDE11744.1 transposase [Riemerella columbipharyngis]